MREDKLWENCEEILHDTQWASITSLCQEEQQIKYTKNDKISKEIEYESTLETNTKHITELWPVIEKEKSKINEFDWLWVYEEINYNRKYGYGWNSKYR